MRDCQECKDYRECVRKHDWFSYQEIRFCPFQFLWIIEHSVVLSDRWPDNPDGSSHVDPQVRTGYRSEGYFAKPAGILGEVNVRLAKTGTAGKLLKAEVLAGLELSQESKDALMYVKGWRRKKLSFSAWKKQRKYYQKVVTPP